MLVDLDVAVLFVSYVEMLVDVDVLIFREALSDSMLLA